MSALALALLVLAAVLAARWGRPRRTAPGVLPPALAAFRAVSPRHEAEARRHAAAFDARYRRTFSPGAAAAPAEGARAMFAARAATLTALHELRMRLPNDLDAERGLGAVIEDADRAMLQRIQDARERTGAVLVHPGPVDAAWYGRWYRAANDAVA